MKQINFRKILPHLVAVVIFLLLSIFMTKPALEGRVIQQHDVIQWKAMAQQSFEYKTKHGHFPRWSNSMFSGMPGYQIAMDAKSPSVINLSPLSKLVTLGLPKPVYYLFLASLCFYFLALTMGVNPWLGILGAIAYGYCSYNPVLITAGHDTKLMSMAFAPAVLAGIQLIFRKRYWLGSLLLLAFGYLMLAENHQQIVYYTFLIAVFMTVPFIIKCIKEKNIGHLLISGGICAVLGLLMLGTVALGYSGAYEVTQETMRGGRSELTQKDKDKKFETKGGLDKDYAFQWSYGKAETMTLLVPNAAGGSSAEGLPEDSKAVEVLQENMNTLPNGFAQQVAQSSPMYWGELYNTSGTVYIGAIVCLLFLLGAFFARSEHRWWLIAISLFGIILAWGKSFEAVNFFLFDHMPFYKKFRAPSMSLVIPQLTAPLLGIIFLDEFTKLADKEKMTQLMKKCLYVTGAVLIVMVGFYFMSDFTNEATNELKKNINAALQGQGSDFTRSYFSGLKADRQAFYLKDMWRSVGFIIAAIAVLFLYSRKLIKPAVLYGALILLCTIDLLGVSKRYLKDENFVEPVDYDSYFADHAADLQIKKDTGYFRILNLAFPGNNGFTVSVGNAFEDAMASYKHNNIGGYSPAKLGLYQDIRVNQLYKNVEAWGANPSAKDSFPVLNMLNMKYVIVPDRRNPAQTEAVINPYAMGNCWLVKEVKFVKNADEEMAALDHFDPAQTAFVDQRFKSSLPFMPVYDSSASIKMLENTNDNIRYEFNAASNQFAVFSEVYYPHGWTVYIDGKPATYCRTDYVLRGMAIPAGKHSIEFKFDPEFVRKGEAIQKWSQILSLLLILFCIFMIWKTGKNKQTEE